jgi:hypothetical protein
MNKVVEILIERDQITQEEAESLVRETRDEILSLDDITEADDIIQDYLQLEPDYLQDILSF